MGMAQSNRLTSIVGGAASSGPGQPTATGGNANVAQLPGVNADVNYNAGGSLHIQAAGIWMLLLGVATWAYIRWVK